MKMKKIAALSLATVMTLGLSATAFAQTAAPTTPDADNATITDRKCFQGRDLHHLPAVQRNRNR